jgi:hypothetical protein
MIVMMKKIWIGMMVLALGLGVAGAGRAQDKSCDDLMKDAESAWVKQNYDGSDKILEQAKKSCPNRAEVYWRQARNEYDRIEEIPRDKKPKKDELIKRYRGIEALADKCSQLDAKDGSCLQWKGIGMGRRGTTQGILNSLGEAKDLEKTFLAAEKLAPQYKSDNGAANALGDIYNALGQLYRVLPEWLCTIGIKQIVGVCGSLDKSVDYNKKAVAREPKRIEYQKELGIALTCRGTQKKKPDDVEAGKKILTDLQSLPEVKKTDAIDKQHAKDVIANPKIACGYSRDAQQEQSQDAYKGPK